MGFLKYAPVVIPTLNRYEHFKRCLESLERCTGADQTEVYVGVDFPPSEKYREGWEKICQYLTEKERCNGFKELHVIRRETNCGVCHPKSNGNLLLNDIKPKFDTYIFTEDDNEFSPCFLDFMNKSFELYNDDKRVLSISGYNQEKFQVQGKNVVFVYDSSAWGTGRWSRKFGNDTTDYIKSVLHSPKYITKLWRTYPKLLQLLISIERHHLKYGDAIDTARCICEEIYQVRPSLSLVRNLGNDGSGLHSGINESFGEQQISTEAVFEIGEIVVERTKELDNALYNNMLPQTIWGKLDTHIRIFASLLLYYIKH